MDSSQGQPVEILLVEDNPGDVELTREALATSKIKNVLNVVRDGDEAMAYLKSLEERKVKRPHLVLLDLNLPGVDGRDVLVEIKEDEDLRTIPVVVMTSSEAEEDILRCYQAHANCYVTKPMDLDSFHKVVSSIEDFWFSIVRLPSS